MIVVPEIVLKMLMTQVVEATHSLTDTGGAPHIAQTINEPQLRMAALVAIQLALGEAVWPGDKTIVIHRPKANYGIFREAG